MDEKDMIIQKMQLDHSREMAKMTSRTLEVASEACLLCVKSGIWRDCNICRVHKIKEDLTE